MVSFMLWLLYPWEKNLWYLFNRNWIDLRAGLGCGGEKNSLPKPGIVLQIIQHIA
jgi:hypothetical protein